MGFLELRRWRYWQERFESNQAMTAGIDPRSVGGHRPPPQKMTSNFSADRFHPRRVETRLSLSLRAEKDPHPLQLHCEFAFESAIARRFPCHIAQITR
jgi:hypothetical protein